MKIPDLSTIRQRIAAHTPAAVPAPVTEHRIAAVLVVIYPGPEEPGIVLTRRSERLPTHPGQISFPGGSLEEQDNSLTATALREAEEEIGLPRHLVEVLGHLEPLALPSGFFVTPVVATVEALPALRADPAEVEEIFTLPLSLIMQDGLFQSGSRVINGIKRSFYHFDYEDYYIWGATAAMLRELARVLGARQP